MTVEMSDWEAVYFSFIRAGRLRKFGFTAMNNFPLTTVSVHKSIYGEWPTHAQADKMRRVLRRLEKQGKVRCENWGGALCWTLNQINLLED